MTTGKEPRFVIDRYQDWLWQVADREAPADLAIVSDETLRRYRAGALPANEQEQLEHRLAASASLRRRLAQIAGVRIAASSRVRQRLFGVPRELRPERWRWLRVAAAVSAMLLVPVCVWKLRNPAVESTEQASTLATSLAGYSIEVRGLADVRSSATSSAATAATVIEIELHPERSIPYPLDVALYRLRGDRLSRIPREQLVAFQQNGGAARLRLRAGELVGSEVGARPFVIGIGRAGALSESLPLPSFGAADRVLAADGSSMFFRRTLSLIDP
jgi:hypothetical protein